MNFDQLIENIEITHDFFQARASKQVDENFTLRNWLIGYYLVEFEQNGQDRAIYGNKTIPTLVKKVSHIKGLSKRNFFLFKQFYQTYPSIVQTLSAQLKNANLNLPSPIIQTVPGQLETIESYPPEILLSQLSFSHFVELIQLDSEIKRRFYEVQVIQSSWSVRGLETID